MLTATARAQPNIALIKYWGKRDATLNLPAVGSISITLDSLRTETRVTFAREFNHDALQLDGNNDVRATARVSACLDLLRARAGTDWFAHIESNNNFPTSAGLASSASGFAALVRAGSAALALSLDESEMSILARRGSGSAARSIFGGFVEMDKGTRTDGADAYAHRLLAAQAWPLTVIVAVTSRDTKKTGSTDGMTASQKTAPFYATWVADAPADLAAARAAILRRDFAALAALSEFSCLKMHAVMLATRPGLIYWSGATVECLHRIRTLREQQGLGVFFTVDAGPQVKAVCLPTDADAVAKALADVPGVVAVMTSALGNGASLISTGSNTVGSAS